MRLATAILSVAVGAAVFATPAHAGTPASVRVSYADLDLTTPAGQAALQARLDKAAHRVCLFDAEGNLRPSTEMAPCYRATHKEVAVQMAQTTSYRQLGG